MTSREYDRKNSPLVFILTGLPQSGKTTFLAGVAARLKERNFITGGFIAPGKFENGQRVLFDIRDLKSGESKHLCSRHFSGGEQIGPFTFWTPGQLFGKMLLKPENLTNVDFVAIDEIGPLELKGGGWADNLRALLQSFRSNQIWVVRKSLVEEVIKKFELTKVKILDTDEVTIDQAVKILCGE